MNVDRFSLPLSAPLRTAAAEITTREGFLVDATAEGARGLGEATPLPGWTESLAACEAALDGVADPVAALDDGALDDAPAARHGVSLAVADARARAAGVPLYRHLGGDHRVERVPVNTTVGDGSPAETADAAAAAADAGVPALKLKVGARPLSADVERLRAARDAFDGELRADANGAWSPDVAAAALEAFAPLGVAYVEQPLAAGDLEGHAALRGSSPATPDGEGAGPGGCVGVALDESLAAADPADVLAAGAADVLVVKPMVLGGPDRARAVALRAGEAGVEPVVTTTVDGVVARAAAVHVAASLPDVRACGLATADRLAADLFADPAPVEGGAVRVPQGNGNGAGAGTGRDDA